MNTAAIRLLQQACKTAIVITCLSFAGILAHPWLDGLYSFPQVLIVTLGLMLVSLALLAVLCAAPCPNCRQTFAGRLSHVPTPFGQCCRYCGESLSR